jgi:hypothetical protein
VSLVADKPLAPDPCDASFVCKDHEMLLSKLEVYLNFLMQKKVTLLEGN